MSLADAPVVLLVDDFPTVLLSTATRLRRAGYEVLEALSGEAALAILESRSDVSVVLCDCNMPGMTGIELATLVLPRWPSIRFVLTSGRADHALPAGVHFLPKPYRLSELIETIAASPCDRDRSRKVA